MKNTLQLSNILLFYQQFPKDKKNPLMAVFP